MDYVHIVFIGHHAPRVQQSIDHWAAKFPPGKFLLVVAKVSGWEKAHQEALKVQAHLKDSFPAIPTVIQYVTNHNPIKAAAQLVDRIGPDRTATTQYLVNYSGGLHAYATTAHYLAFITQSMVVSAIAKYNGGGNEIGVEGFPASPPPKFEMPGKGQMKLLQTIGPGVSSVKELIIRLDPTCETDPVTYKRLHDVSSRRLNWMENHLGLVTTHRAGLERRIRPTPLGVLYAKAAQYGFLE